MNCEARGRRESRSLICLVRLTKTLRNIGEYFLPPPNFAQFSSVWKEERVCSLFIYNHKHYNFLVLK
jgi:hypothetical protein